ncbi:MAG: hypothetical protein C4567_07800 [Deltaproteobacteria bacterium]|nr:MAG: hypothetical protein C4567_07800 [Deltaproteobacteria bacterium]
MPKAQEKSFGEKFNTWAQTIGIIIGSIIVFLWGVTTFVYEKIWLPKSAPVNITLDMAIQNKGTGVCLGSSNEAQFDAIEMKFSAQNPSKKIIYLLPNKFIVYGYNVTAKNSDFSPEFPDKRGIKYLLESKYYTLNNRSIVVIGDLIHDFFLKPGEQSRRSIVFFIPKGKYDTLEVIARIPTTSKETKDYQLKWKYNKNIDDIEYSMWHLLPNGNKEELKKKPKPEGGFEGYPNEFDWQYFENCSMHSMW